MADQGTEGLLSYFLRRKRIHAAKPYLLGRILDVGCGSGALTELVDPVQYLGVEKDEVSLNKAQLLFPIYRFDKCLPKKTEKFDTVVALAVIEHVEQPLEFLRELSSYLCEYPYSRIVLTTPHPSFSKIHAAGAMVGLFSKHAKEEHHGLLSRSELDKYAKLAGLEWLAYHRFLFGANQLAIFKKLHNNLQNSRKH